MAVYCCLRPLRAAASSATQPAARRHGTYPGSTGRLPPIFRRMERHSCSMSGAKESRATRSCTFATPTGATLFVLATAELWHYREMGSLRLLCEADRRPDSWFCRPGPVRRRRCQPPTLQSITKRRGSRKGSEFSLSLRERIAGRAPTFRISRTARHERSRMTRYNLL